MRREEQIGLGSFRITVFDRALKNGLLEAIERSTYSRLRGYGRADVEDAMQEATLRALRLCVRVAQKKLALGFSRAVALDCAANARSVAMTAKFAAQNATFETRRSRRRRVVSLDAEPFEVAARSSETFEPSAKWTPKQKAIFNALRRGDSVREIAAAERISARRVRYEIQLMRRAAETNDER